MHLTWKEVDIANSLVFEMLIKFVTVDVVRLIFMSADTNITPLLNSMMALNTQKPLSKMTTILI